MGHKVFAWPMSKDYNITLQYIRWESTTPNRCHLHFSMTWPIFLTTCLSVILSIRNAICKSPVSFSFIIDTFPQPVYLYSKMGKCHEVRNEIKIFFLFRILHRAKDLNMSVDLSVRLRMCSRCCAATTYNDTKT